MSLFGCSSAAVVAQSPRHGNCKSCGGSFAPVQSFLTPGLLPLFSTVTGRCLAARTIYAAVQSPHGTILDRPISQSSSAKKVIIRHGEFSEKFGILEKHQNQMMKLEMHGFSAILYVCQEMVRSSQQPPEGGCWVPFSCIWGTEGGPMDPSPGARHTLQPGGPPSCGTWGALLSPSGRLAGAHKQSVPFSGGKIVLALENS